MIQSYNDTVYAIKTDPLVGTILPEVINMEEVNSILDGVRKVSEVVDIVIGFYKGPEVTPMFHILLMEFKEVVDKEPFIGEIKKNWIKMPYT